jgi:hypothetical protein
MAGPPLDDGELTLTGGALCRFEPGEQHKTGLLVTRRRRGMNSNFQFRCVRRS